MAIFAHAADGPRIRAARERAGLTQVQLAHRVGIKGAALGHIERGIRGGKPATLKAIADALGVEFEDITKAVAS